MDVQKYRQVMERIKGRTDYVTSIYRSAESMGKVSVFMVESICLQLRMAIEDIAVACIVANASEMPAVANRLKKEYRPRHILKSLEEINPKCYPIPMVENVSGSTGRFRDTHERPEGDWLTKNDAKSGYGKLSNFVHQNLKYYDGPPIDLNATYSFAQELTTKIFNLLSHHHITVLDENKMYRVIMSSSSDGNVQVAEFERVDDLKVDDIIKEFDALSDEPAAKSKGQPRVTN
ncbi:MAG: hypothetical protein F4X02_14670 [Chloroflexi bacterium]|nr:hypothetical protein [Chloroflexota bacterium]